MSRRLCFALFVLFFTVSVFTAYACCPVPLYIQPSTKNEIHLMWRPHFRCSLLPIWNEIKHWHQIPSSEVFSSVTAVQRERQSSPRSCREHWGTGSVLVQTPDCFFFLKPFLSIVQFSAVYETPCNSAAEDNVKSDQKSSAALHFVG